MAYTYRDDFIYHISPITEDITIEDRQPIIAGESNSHYMFFVLDGGEVDGVDISSMDIKVEWANTGNGAHDATPVINKQSLGDLEFGWVIPPEACYAPGNLYFRIRVDGPDNYIWLTKDAVKPVIKSTVAQYFDPNYIPPDYESEIVKQIRANAEAIEELKKNGPTKEDLLDIVNRYFEENPPSAGLNETQLANYLTAQGYAKKSYVDAEIEKVDKVEILVNGDIDVDGDGNADFTAGLTEEKVSQMISEALGVIENGTY